MKKTIKAVSIVSILIFGILWISSKFSVENNWNNADVRGVLVLLYLVTSNKFYKLELQDKNEEIAALKEIKK